MLPVALIAGAALGAGQAIYGAAQKKKAQRLADANVMPEYKIAPEEQQMLSQAESMAGQGMSDSAREAMRQNSNQLLGTGIDAILRGGGNPNAIGNLAGKVQRQINNAAIYEDQARLENLARLQAARARMSANRDKSYQVNQYQPWANKAQAINQQQQGGQQMMVSGINNLTSGLLGSVGSLGQQGAKQQGYIPQQAQTPSLPSTAPINQDLGNFIIPSQLPSPQMNNYADGYQGIGQPFGMMSPLPTLQGNNYGFEYQATGQPFGMLNEEVNNTPMFNGWGFQ